MDLSQIALPAIVDREQWLAARKRLLADEKELTRRRDRVNDARRKLPMVEVTNEYMFDGPRGRSTLFDLFDGRRQLIVYHFMFEPGEVAADGSIDMTGEGCPGCSYLVDNIGHLAHLRARDTTLVLVSRAQRARIEAFQKRMGWTVPWFSSYGSTFNYDFHVTIDESVAPVQYNYQDKATIEEKGETYHLAGEQPGVSVFLRDGDRVFHTYSTYGRGMDPLVGTYQWLDLTAFGRGEGWDGMPDLNGEGMQWTKHHDRYPDEQPQQAAAGLSIEPVESCCSKK